MICFHHNDLDGKCAGAIVYFKHNNCRMIKMGYSKKIPFHLIKKDETVYIVDFSFKPDQMAILMQITENIVWIDHHKTILDHIYNIDSIKGIRDINHSGAYLTWKFLFPEKKIPYSVEMVSDYDTWTLKDSHSMPFRFGMDLMNHDPKCSIWLALFDDRGLDMIVDNGKTVLKFIDNIGKDYCKSYGFETDFEGYNCFAQGFYMFGSNFFGDKINQYDICLSYEFNGNNWIVGLYSKKVDVSVIAKKYGGGGHTGAAGFVCDNLPFKSKEVK